jgi:hypothetical protein
MQWVTRQYLHLDRVATPWLITRFVDPQATFLYVPWKEEHLAPPGAIGFSLPGAELGPHDHTGTTFDKVMRKYKLDDAALAQLADVVRAGVAYVLEGYRPPANDTAGQTAVGLLAFAEGVFLTNQSDDAILAASFPVYDALYANFRVLELLKFAGQEMPDHSDGRGPSKKFEGLRQIYNESNVGGKPTPYGPATAGVQVSLGVQASLA